MQTVAPQRLPQMHNGKIIIIAYKMLMGNVGQALAGGVAGTKQDPSAMEKWQMFGKRQAAAGVESALKTF